MQSFDLKKLSNEHSDDAKETKRAEKFFMIAAIDESGIDEKANHGRQCFIEDCIRHLPSFCRRR
jgi:hypothetical protein